MGDSHLCSETRSGGSFLWYAKTLKDLDQLSDDDLVDQHDWHAKDKREPVDVTYYLDELARRYSKRMNKDMLRLTKWIAFFALVSTLAVVVSTAAVIISA